MFLAGLAPAFGAFDAELQGRSRDSSTWISGNLQNWRELDYIPCRVHLTGGPATSRQITIEFDHVQGRIPAIQNLTSFTPSANVVITSGPILSAPADSDRWTYTFTIDLLDRQPGWVEFRARLAAGSHMNVGSSAGLRGTPSLGSLQIHKPAPGVGQPDLVLTKSGAAEAAPSEVIHYTLTFSNKVSSMHAATGAQISDVLPAEVTLLTNTVTGGEIVGNFIFWDLGNVSVGASGSLSYSVRVNANVAYGQMFTNSALVLSAEDDANLSDNSSSVATRVGFNRSPVALDDSYSTSEDTSLIVNAPGVLANDSDPDGQVLSARLVTSPAHGTVVLNGDGSFTYTPATNFYGEDNFTYRVTDGSNESSIATAALVVSPRNDAPVAVGDGFNINENSSLVVAAAGVPGNDSDPDGDALRATLVSGPSHGTLSLNQDGSFTYSPAGNFHGEDSFVYAAEDGLASASATVAITIIPVNDAPLTIGDAYSTDEDRPLVVSAPGILSNDSDIDGDALSAILAGGPGNGTLTLNTNGGFTYVPAPNFHGTDSFVYRATDGALLSSNVVVRITVNAINDPPTAAPDAFTVTEDVAVSIGAQALLANDADIDGDALTIRITAPPSYGSLSAQPDGALVYSPVANFNGMDAFTYSAHDGITDSQPTTVLITVLPVNDAPSFTPGKDVIVTQSTGSQTLPGWATNISSGPVDEAGQSLQFIAAVNRPELFAIQPSVSPAGALSFAPAADAYGLATIMVVLHDDGGVERGGIDTSREEFFTITINKTNTPPQVSILHPADGAVYIAGMRLNVVAEASDSDGEVVRVELLEGDTLLGTATTATLFHSITGLVAGAREFRAAATDNLGASAQSAPVGITVLAQPPHAAGPFTLNRQTGLFEQRVRITNPTLETFHGVRLHIQNVRPEVVVWNAMGQSNGIPYVDAQVQITAGGFTEILVTYHAPDIRVPPDPVFIPELLFPADRERNQAARPVIARTYRQADGKCVVEFTALSTGTYCVQHSEDLTHWQTSPVSPTSGGTVRWVDPVPTASSYRFYRLVYLP